MLRINSNSLGNHTLGPSGEDASHGANVTQCVSSLCAISCAFSSVFWMPSSLFDADSRLINRTTVM